MPAPKRRPAVEPEKKPPPPEGAPPLRRWVTGPFLWAGLIWSLLAVIFTWAVHPPAVPAWDSIKWTITLSALCLADLAVLSKMVAVLFEWLAASPQGKSTLTIRTLYWCTLKVACMGVIGLVLLIQGAYMPVESVILGTGTLAFVPLAAGYWWSRKELARA